MDDGSSPAAGIIVFLLLVAAEFIFYGFGTAVQQINEHLTEERAQAGDRRAKRLLVMMQEPGHYVNTLQSVSVFTGIIIGFYEIRRLRYLLTAWLTGFAWMRNAQLAESIVMIVVVLTMVYLLVTVGVTVPKRIAAKAPEKWAYRFVNLMYGLTVLFRPFTYLISVTAYLILRPFGIDARESEDDVTEEGIISMVNEGHEQGVLEENEVEMIHNIIGFGDKEAGDIMIHRKNIVALDGSDTLNAALAYILGQSYSRFPVFEDDLDNIIGVLHLKDAMKCYWNESLREARLMDIEDLVRPVGFIPETRNIDLIFRDMQSQKMHLTIVVDEYGQTAGLIAMEDILEEIVGNIMDEYDEDENYIIKQGEDTWLVKGITPLEELEEVLHLTFEEEEFDTLNGLLISVLDRIPNEGEQMELTFEGYVFQILEVTNKMIQSVRITRM